MAPLRTRRKANRFFDVAAPHKKARRPFAYHIPFLAKFHLYGPHRKKQQAAVLGGSFAFLILIIFVFQAEALFANLRTLHPATCSGDWQDAATLTGEPELGEEGALATQAGQKIFCSFAIPKLKEPVPLTRAVLALSFKNEQPSPLIEESGGTEEYASTTEPIAEEIPVEEISPSEPVPEPVAEETPVSESIVEEESTPEPAIEEAPEPASEPEPVSSIWRMFSAPVAYAQEQPVVEEVSAEEIPAAESVQEPVVEEVSAPTEETSIEETPTFEPTIEEALVGESSGSPESSGPKTSLTISYTLDGVIWTDLTTFSPRDNEVTFDLDIISSEEIEKLVVRVTAEEVGGEPVYLRAAELRIWTEAPLDELLEPILEESIPGVRVYEREFSIDPNATHSCALLPATLDLSSATTTQQIELSLMLGENLGSGIQGVVANVSEDVLEIVTGTSTPEALALLPEEVPVEVVFTEEPTATTSNPIVASTSESIVEEDVEKVPDGILDSLQIVAENLITEVASSTVAVLEDATRFKVGTVEIGGLPKGIDVRFPGESPYAIDVLKDQTSGASLLASVVLPEGAQVGSFTVPVIFTRTDDGESTVVCQLNIVHRPGETEGEE